MYEIIKVNYTQSINSFGGLSDDFSGDGLRGSLTHKSSPTDEWTRWQNVEIFALGNYTDFIGLLKLRCFWQASWHSVKEYINSFFFNQYIRLKIHLYFYGPRTKHMSFCPWVGHYDVTFCLAACIKPDTPINVYTRFCLNTAKSKFSLVSPVADWWNTINKQLNWIVY